MTVIHAKSAILIVAIVVIQCTRHECVARYVLNYPTTAFIDDSDVDKSGDKNEQRLDRLLKWASKMYLDHQLGEGYKHSPPSLFAGEYRGLCCDVIAHVSEMHNTVVIYMY